MSLVFPNQTFESVGMSAAMTVSATHTVWPADSLEAPIR